MPALFSLLASANTEKWVEVQTPHFVILTNSGDKHGRRLADEFERMRAVFHKRFPKASVDSASPIIVIAVKDKKDFQTLEPAAYLAQGQLNLAGLFLHTPDKNYVLLRLDAEGKHPYAAVYHEYTHFIVRGAAGWLPLWLNEGWAQFYENTEIKNREVGMGEPSAEKLMLLRRSRPLPLATLLAVDRNSPYYHEENQGHIFYAESWALTHYLTLKDDQDKTDRLATYVKLVSTNVDSVTAATRAFGDLKTLEGNLNEYIAQPKFYYFKMPGTTDVDETSFHIRSATPNQADVIRADFMAYNQRPKDARPLLDRVLRDEPNNVDAHETMGLAALDEGKFEEASKWYEQALNLDSQSFLAHYYFAATAMRLPSWGNRSDRIEASLRSAIKLNPSFAPSFDQLASFYWMQHKNLQEASTLSSTAIQLDPGNIAFLVNRANLMMEMERPTEAIAALQAAVKLSSKPEQLLVLQRKLESIQQYETARIAKAHENSLEQASPELHYNLGNALLSNSDLDGAIAEYRHAIHLKPDFPEAHLSLGNSLGHSHDLYGAITEYREAIRLKPDLAPAHLSLGDALVEKDDVNGGIAEYREAIRLKPDFALAHRELGYELMFRGERQASLEELRRVLALNPGDDVVRRDVEKLSLEARDK
ncbi:MAG TPA: tetratricopeptide repeat protein [Terriglobales bacterium]|nr:tetratricopeptide repeat protein [Terriglobales bacterium]